MDTRELRQTKNIEFKTTNNTLEKQRSWKLSSIWEESQKTNKYDKFGVFKKLIIII